MTLLTQTDLSVYGTDSSIKLLEEISKSKSVGTSKWVILSVYLEDTIRFQFDRTVVKNVLAKCICTGDMLHDNEVMSVKSHLRKMLLSDTVH